MSLINVGSSYDGKHVCMLEQSVSNISWYSSRCTQNLNVLFSFLPQQPLPTRLIRSRNNQKKNKRRDDGEEEKEREKSRQWTGKYVRKLN